MTTWIVVLLLANQQLTWLAADHAQCVSIEEQVLLGRDVGLTTLAGVLIPVVSALCMTKDEAQKHFGFWKGSEV